MRQQRMLEGRSQRESLDALHRPVGGDLAATHAPDLFGVGLEEDAEKPFTKLIDYPLLEISWRGIRT